MADHDAAGNSVLAALNEDDIARWRPNLQLVKLLPNQVLSESGTPMHHAYFPLDCIVSLIQIVESGASAEYAMVGREGLVGVSLLLGGGSAPKRIVVQAGGDAYRCSSEFIQQEFAVSTTVFRVVLRFMQALMTQIALTAVCNRLHALEQRMCRRLLMSLDRVDDQVIRITHKQLAGFLGVRREGVTACALKLQQSGSILYSRGRLEVLDRSGLERCACECYGVVAEEYVRLLPGR